MDNDLQRRISMLEERITQLPRGSISYKSINGKRWPYLQWTEGGKSRSVYIKKEELSAVEAQVKERKELQRQLKALKSELPPNDNSVPNTAFRTNVVTGSALLAMTKGVRDWQKRDCFSMLWNYLNSVETDRVCLVYGLRRTGKTTLLRQAVLEMTPEQAAQTAYLKARGKDTVADMDHDLKLLFAQGFRYVLLDEVTLMADFIDSAALFSDIYAAQGMKLVLSGTDSLGFWFALDQELYDRAIAIHTTFIPFREHSRLLGIHDIDEYIRYGGTLRVGELNFESDEVNAVDASFRDDESTRRYIDTAICRNIQHSLACCESGGHFRHLRELYEADELTGAINRIIESMNHEFLVRVLVQDFKSHDLGSAAQLLRKERDPDRYTDVLDRIDRETVTNRLMKLLEIRNKEDQSIGIKPIHVTEIKEYLRALDLIVDCPIETTTPDAEPLEHILFTQPGMRYCQAQALVYSLMKDPLFRAVSEREKKLVTDRILEDVRGRMMEEIVLLETMKAKSRNQRVFKLQFARGEFDMVVYDAEADHCSIFEIKHSREMASEQCRHLLDDEKCRLTQRKYGQIIRKCVLYRGENQEDAAVCYRNVEGYLEHLSDLSGI